MAKTETTVKSYYYTVTSPNGGTVTDGSGKLNKEVAAGDQVTVQAPSDSLTCSDDDAVIYKANFNGALAALGLLGGGVDKLPAGYTRVEFLESTGTQWININYALYPDSEVSIVAEAHAHTVSHSGGLIGLDFTQNLYAIWMFSDRTRWDWYSGHANGKAIPVGQKAKLEKKGRFNFIDGVEITASPIPSNPPEWIITDRCGLFCSSPPHFPQSAFEGAIYSARIGYAGVLGRSFIPALDTTGRPCMFDLVSKQPFYNARTGAEFIAGLTLGQAAQLGRNLPNTGGSLTVSLPEGYDMDERVVNALAEAESKGWVLTIQTYAAQTAAATFALRRVWVRRVQDENGSYVAADGSRWQVEWCVEVIGADPEGLGYERFRSVEAAVAYWELAPYEYPEEIAD